MQMKGFAKIALTFALLAGMMAYFIVPVQFSRKRALSSTEKAEYALTVNYYKSHGGEAGDGRGLGSLDTSGGQAPTLGGHEEAGALPASAATGERATFPVSAGRAACRSHGFGRCDQCHWLLLESVRKHQ